MEIKPSHCLTLAAIGVAAAMIFSPADKPQPPPDDPPPKQPCPAPKPEPYIPPTPPRKPWGPSLGAAVAGEKSPDGKEAIQIDLPGDHHQRNGVGIDGLGLCVFASMKHTGDWQGDPAFYGLFEWMKRKPGGGMPNKVDLMLRQFCAEKGFTKPDYFHIQTADLDVLRLACKNRLMPCVGYWRSPTGRYGGGRISHMVSLVHATQDWFAILDNNYIGEDQYEWMNAKEFTTALSEGGDVWAMVLLTPPPPNPPHNRG